MSFIGQTDYDHKSKLKTGVLICNLGTPDNSSPRAVRKFLKQFLSDNRVIEIPKIIWWFILNCIILRVRPRKSAKLYQSIWTKAGSPLLVYSQSLVDKLKSKYSDHEFALGMRYGAPSLEQALLELKHKNCGKIIVLPLFPQYSGTTTGSMFEEVSRILSKWRWIPSVDFINSYHDNPDYVSAIAESIAREVKNSTPQKIIFSYHGIPKRNFEQGDPYYCFCQKTTRLIAEKLNLQKDLFLTAFQSRFGRLEWLKPYTIDVMQQLPKDGIDNILVIAPGFAADCLETIEEISGENKNEFIKYGGKKFTYVPCLNDSDAHVSLIHKIIERH